MSNPLTVRQFVKYEYEVDRYSTGWYAYVFMERSNLFSLGTYAYQYAYLL
jgi:hypothetical protein